MPCRYLRPELNKYYDIHIPQSACLSVNALPSKRGSKIFDLAISHSTNKRKRLSGKVDINCDDDGNQYYEDSLSNIRLRDMVKSVVQLSIRKTKPGTVDYARRGLSINHLLPAPLRFYPGYKRYRMLYTYRKNLTNNRQRKQKEIILKKMRN